MKFAKPTLIALSTTMAAAPTSVVVDAWNMGPTYLSLPTSLQLSSMNRMLERERMIAQRMFDMVDGMAIDHPNQQQKQQIVRYRPSHQRYELIDNNELFELKVDVPGVKEEDLDIKLNGDRKLTIEGKRMVTSEVSNFVSTFSKTFSFDKTVDVDKFTASLNNGVLVVSAPKDLAKLEESIRKIPITASTTTHTDADDEADVAKLEGKAHNNDILTAKDDNTEEQHKDGVEDKKADKVSPENDTLELDAPDAE